MNTKGQTKTEGGGAVASSALLGVGVTRIGNRWVGVLTVNGKEYDRMACALKSDIGWMCREMLRWYDKLGGNSAWAKSARRRQSGRPSGKVWYANALAKTPNANILPP